MKKSLIIFFGVACYSSFVFAQDSRGIMDLSKIPAPRDHFQVEYCFDSTTKPERWMNQKSGLQVSFASTDQAYFRSEAPDINSTSVWEGTGWKGERLNIMILLWSTDSINQIRFVLRNLANTNGQSLNKENINLHLVRYVVSNYPYNAGDAVCDVSPHKSVYLMPDRFENFRQFDLPGKTVRPVWLSVDIPSTIAPGMYKGSIEVQSEKSRSILNVSIKVQKELLPKPHDWKFRLDLWQNPWVIAWYNHVEPWSPDHKAMLKKHLALYANAGGKYITTYAVHSPWADNSYMIEETMIEWVKRKSGAWKFDYSIFDQYVQLAMDAGIDKAITIYTPVPWGNRFRYMDEATGNYIYAIWEPGSNDFKNVWNAFLTDLQKHLQQKGWLDKTYLGINENTMEQTLATIRVIKAHSNKWKITYAGDWHRELNSLLNDYSFLYSKEPDIDVVKKRSARGFTSTYYICCNPPKPNDFVFSPPVEGRWLSWYSAAHGYNGLLRWAYDAWPADPTRDARHTVWPAGDCFLVYPGGTSCIRFEKLREGISDYEKIRILKEQAAVSTNTKAKELAKELDAHLQLFYNEHEFKTEKITHDLDKGKKLVDELSDLLGK